METHLQRIPKIDCQGTVRERGRVKAVQIRHEVKGDLGVLQEGLHNNRKLIVNCVPLPGQGVQSVVEVVARVLHQHPVGLAALQSDINEAKV